ncbi:hypothetical protein AMS68_003472 [Peltaster fructicola]|uniref:Uncharacterized protein n=1 Tax=Peltaster fructicola TaxID=286661 RepID=A0A6H0XTI8_9PEZI|nr:hypothetical protein AMS68_003472 [Peltaster fructicola]
MASADQSRRGTRESPDPPYRATGSAADLWQSAQHSPVKQELGSALYYDEDDILVQSGENSRAPHYVNPASLQPQSLVRRSWQPFRPLERLSGTDEEDPQHSSPGSFSRVTGDVPRSSGLREWVAEPDPAADNATLGHNLASSSRSHQPTRPSRYERNSDALIRDRPSVAPRAELVDLAQWPAEGDISDGERKRLRHEWKEQGKPRCERSVWYRGQFIGLCFGEHHPHLHNSLQATLNALKRREESIAAAAAAEEAKAQESSTAAAGAETQHARAFQVTLSKSAKKRAAKRARAEVTARDADVQDLAKRSPPAAETKAEAEQPKQHKRRGNYCQRCRINHRGPCRKCFFCTRGWHANPCKGPQSASVAQSANPYAAALQQSVTNQVSAAQQPVAQTPQNMLRFGANPAVPAAPSGLDQTALSGSDRLLSFIFNQVHDALAMATSGSTANFPGLANPTPSDEIIGPFRTPATPAVASAPASVAVVASSNAAKRSKVVIPPTGPGQHKL